MRIVPADAPIGAVVEDLDLRRLAAAPDPAVVQALLAALDQHLVLRLRGELEHAELVRFAGLFGNVLSDRRNSEEPGTVHIEEVPELKVISNARTEDGRAYGDKGAEAQIWHTDGSQRAEPNAYSILACRAAPEPPPATFFMSCYALYEGLPAALKREIRGRRAIFAAHNRSQGFLSFTEGASLPPERRAEGVRHPLVRLHPRTRRPFLYLPRRRDALVEGLGPEASRWLMERLWAAVFACDATWSVALRAGEIVMNDNRATLHGREGWAEESERVVLHASVAPEVPEPAYAALAQGHAA